MSNRRWSALLAALFLFCTGCSSCGLPEAPNVPPGTRPSLGELVFRIIRSDLALSDSCPTEYVAALETHHADFVTTFDYVIENGVQNNLPDVLGGTIQPFVANDKLPRLVDTLAETLALLVSNEFDPNRLTLQAMVNLSEAQTLLESSIAIQTAGALLADPSITDKIHALATLAQENDGVTYVMDDMIDVASYALEADPTNPGCTGLASPDPQTTLLRTAGFVEDARFALGTPFYLARPDANGNPAVASAGGTLLGPFVDVNRDGVADTNANGDPIDANGQVIDLAMIDEDGAPGRDMYGRAVDTQNRPIYTYYDVKRTALSYTLQIGADLMETGVHHDLPVVVNAALGTPVPCTDGLNCRVYPSNQNVIADLAFLGFELAEYSRMGVLLRTISQLLTTNPTKAEELLVAIGDIVKALDATNISLTDTSIVDAVAGLIPLLEQVFETPNNSASTPTARVLVDVLQGLGAQADAMPSDINYMVVNQWDPDTANDLERVNFANPRYFNGDDNRSGLEQLIELFYWADCGYIGPDGIFTLRNAMWVIITAIDPQVSTGTLAQVLVDMLSRMSPSTVATLQDLIAGIQGLVGNGLLSTVVQSATGCTAQQSDKIAQHLPALGILADSGGLDWILPLANTFKQQGQLRLLIDIFRYLALDLQYDEDGNAASISSIRRLMPLLNTITTPQQAGVPTSTPLNRVLDAIEILLTINASDGNGNAIDVVVDAMSFMTNTTSVQTRSPTTNQPVWVAGTSLAGEMLKAVKRLQMRVSAAGAGPTLSRVLDAITPLLTTTTGAGTARRLANPNLRMLAATYLDYAAQLATLPQSNYLCYVRDGQADTVAFLTSKHLATVARVFNHLATSPNAAGLEDWILEMLRGKPTDRDGELYGRLMQLGAGALSTTASAEDMSHILDWLAAGITVTGAGGMREMVQTFDELLQSDSRGAILTMARTVIQPGPLPSRERPVTTFANTADAVAQINANDMCMATGPTVTVADMEASVQELSDFLVRNPTDGITTGIEQIWGLVGSIAPTE